MSRVLQIETDTPMPPFGVVEAIAPGHDTVDLMQLWLVSHTSGLGSLFWRAAVLRECLPNPDELEFVALSPVVRQQPRTALVRVAVGGAL
jgi:hypothetical protein